METHWEKVPSRCGPGLSLSLLSPGVAIAAEVLIFPRELMWVQRSLLSQVWRRPAVFIPISRRSSSPGGPSCQATHLGLWHQHCWKCSYCWQVLFLHNTFSQRGINGAHTEAGSEEALRKKSHCASEELMLFFPGVIFQEDMLES